jgi:hypothetical protein
MESFYIRDSSSLAPLTGLSPAFLRYASLTGPLASPPIHNLGSGLYGFEPAPGDLAPGVGWVVDCGAGALPRYVYGGAGDDRFWLGQDGAGTPVAGLTWTVSAYRTGAGAGATSPAVVDCGGGLYGFSPSDADRAADVSFVVSSGVQVYSGSVVDLLTGGGGAPVVVVRPAPDWSPTPPAANAIPVGRDLGFDRTTGRFIFQGGDLVLTTGLAAVRQAVDIELNTLKGEYYLDLTAGVPWFDGILGKGAPIRTIRQIFMERILSVTGVVDVPTLTVDVNAQTRKLTAAFVARADAGTFEGGITL